MSFCKRKNLNTSGITFTNIVICNTFQMNKKEKKELIHTYDHLSKQKRDNYV